jgi:hypothetical protein
VKKVTEFMEFKLGRERQAKIVVKKEKSHPSHAIVAKVKNLNPARLKNLMVKKMLLKAITQIYLERYSMAKDSEQCKSQDLASFVYDVNMNKYGLKRVTE